jgi:hypothetical protein
MTTTKKSLLIYSALLVAGVIARLVPHPANFTPVGTIMLFGAFYFSRSKVGWLVFLPILLVSDALLGFYDWRLMLVVYGSFLVMALWGVGLRKNYSYRGALTRVIGGSFSFFATTNFAVWALSSWYPHTLAGLLTCYEFGLPFFRATLAGDIFFGAAIFGAYSLARYGIMKRQNEQSKAYEYSIL